MKDELDQRTPFRRFDDEVAKLIDSAPAEMTVAELVGCLELQLHVLKNRSMGYRQVEPEKKE